MLKIDRRSFVAGSAAALAAPALSGRARAATKRLGLAWDRQFAPSAIVPKAVAFAKEAGLDIDLTPFGRGLDGMIAMQKGDVQAADGLVNFFHFCIAHARGVDLTVVSGACQRLISILISPKLVPAADQDEKNRAYTGKTPWELLRGRKVGTARGSQPDFALQLYLRAHGMDPLKDIEFVDLKTNTDQALALRQGSIDAAIIIEPVATRARMDGYALLLDHPYRETDFTRINSPLIVRTDFLKANPEAVQILVDAHVKAIDYYKANPKIWIDDTAAVTLIDKEVLQRVLDPQALDLDPKRWQNIELNYAMPKSQILALAQSAFENKVVEKDVTKIVEAKIDYSFLAKATGKSPAELGA